MKLTKQTSKGEAVIEVLNGTATATINGQSTGSTSGMVQYLKPFGPNTEFVGGICKIALTKLEAAEVEKMLAVREPATVAASGTRGGGIWSHCYTAEVNRAGDINKFAKGGVQ